MCLSIECLAATGVQFMKLKAHAENVSNVELFQIISPRKFVFRSKSIIVVRVISQFFFMTLANRRKRTEATFELVYLNKGLIVDVDS